jgi:hypothetical protein
MKLSREQKDLLISLSTNYKTGLNQSQDPDFTYTIHAELNIINPPLNCPKWACIILPCISHIPSMKLFKQIVPRDAEVRLNNKWVCYDATSLNVGDIIRLNEGDIVPADVKLLNLGLDFVNDTDEDAIPVPVPESIVDQSLEIIVDSSQIDGRTKPLAVALNQSDGTVDAVELYAGSIILQGEAIAVVTKIGGNLLLSQLIRDGQWPPKAKAGWQAVNQRDDEEEDSGSGRGQELV